MDGREPLIGVAAAPDADASLTGMIAAVGDAGGRAVHVPVPAPAGDPSGSLVAREVAADTLEVAAEDLSLEGLVSVQPRGMILPASVMATVRTDLPFVLVSPDEPGPADARLIGAIRALGLATARDVGEAARTIIGLVREGRRPGALLSRPSFAAAAAALSSPDGSADGALHLLALAFEAEVDLDLRDLAEAGLPVLHGSLAPEGAIAASSEHSSRVRGRARVYESLDGYLGSLGTSPLDPDEVAVVRNVGPRGGPGMPVVPPPPSGIALVTDGRLVEAPGCPSFGHLAPESAEGGPIAAVVDGDPVSIDREAARIDLEIPEEVLWGRLERWFPPAPRHVTGALAKYARLVKSASRGAVCY